MVALLGDAPGAGGEQALAGDEIALVSEGALRFRCHHLRRLKSEAPKDGAS